MSSQPNWTPVACAFLGILSVNGQVNVLTYHNDLSRTGQNLNETILTPANVRSGEFGELFRNPVDGQVYGQPLYMWGLNIPGRGIHNVVFVATEHDSVYAFDADGNAGQNANPLWHTSFIDPAGGVTTVPAENLVCKVISPEVGITSTPVIDPNSRTLYVVAMTLEDFGQTYVQRLHALDVATGAEKPGSPVQIEASVPGTGDGNSTVTFKPGLYKDRPGLLLLNGIVYTAWSSHCDSGNYHGWLIGYDAHSLKRSTVFTSTPNWGAGSIWQSGAAPAADTKGHIYVVTGNGTFDAASGGFDLSDSVIKLSTASGLTVVDYFTPYDADMLSLRDLDLGSSGVVLLPDSVGTAAHPHLMITGSKEGRVYVLDRDLMGHFQAGSDGQIVQSLPAAIGPLFGVPVYFNQTVYFAARNDSLKAFTIANGLLSETPDSQSTGPVAYLGSVPSISANGSSDGILWSIDPVGLHAYDAANLATELYRGSLDSYIKFSTPTIANGKVYGATEDRLVVSGLLTAPGIDLIVNAAGFQTGGVAPGSIVSVFGTNLADDTQPARLLINGIAAPLLYTSPTQINAQIPCETSLGAATVVAMRGSSASSTMKIQIQQASPGAFSAVLNQDGTVNGPLHPAAPATILKTFLTGLGPAQPPVSSGIPSPPNPQSHVVLPLSATIGGQNAAVMSASLALGLIGIFDVGLVVPDLPPGSYPLIIEAGGVASNELIVTISQ